MREHAARDAGRDHFRLYGDAILIHVAREAALVYPDSKLDQLAYLEGYRDARRQHDEYLQEKQS